MKKLIVLNLILILLWSCEKDPASKIVLVVSTGEATAITQSGATIGLSINDNSTVKEIGIVVSSDYAEPSYEKGIIISSDNELNPHVSLSYLIPGTLYYYRAFATDGNVITYGDVKTFTTGSDSKGLPCTIEIWEYNATADGWTLKTAFSSIDRSYPVAFSIGEKGYFGTGWDGASARNDVYAYNPTTNTIARVKDYVDNDGTFMATAFTIDGAGYIADGRTNHLWSYSPLDNKWIQKANAGSTDWRTLAASFSIGNKAYISTGSTKYLSDTWEYNSISDNWVQKADILGVGRWGAFGFTIGNKGYVGGGSSIPLGNFPHDLYEFDSSTNTWTKKADLPITFYRSPCFSIGNKGYVLNNGSVYEYSQDTNKWTKKNNSSSFSTNSCCFTINSKGYLIQFKSKSKSDISSSDKERLTKDLQNLKNMQLK